MNEALRNQNKKKNLKYHLITDKSVTHNVYKCREISLCTPNK